MSKNAHCILSAMRYSVGMGARRQGNRFHLPRLPRAGKIQEHPTHPMKALTITLTLTAAALLAVGQAADRMADAPLVEQLAERNARVCRVNPAYCR